MKSPTAFTSLSLPAGNGQQRNPGNTVMDSKGTQLWTAKEHSNGQQRNTLQGAGPECGRSYFKKQEVGYWYMRYMRVQTMTAVTYTAYTEGAGDQE